MVDKLYTAIKRGKKNDVQKIIDSNKNLDLAKIRNEKDFSPIQFAMAQTHLKSLDMPRFLIKNGAFPDLQNLLIKNIKNENLTAVELLIELGADINFLNEDNVTPLMIAVNTNKKFDIARYLTKKKAKADKSYMTDLLFAAVLTKNLKKIDFLLEWGCDVNARNSNNETLLMFASIYTQDDNSLVYLIYHKGAKITNEVLVYAISYSDNLDRLRFLFDMSEVDINKPLKEFNNQSFLHIAVSKNDNLDVTRFLVEYKHSRLSAVDNNLNTPLHMAAKYSNNVKIVKYLVNKGKHIEGGIFGVNADRKKYVVDINAINNKNETPLSLAMDRGLDGQNISRYLSKVGGVLANFKMGVGQDLYRTTY